MSGLLSALGGGANGVVQLAAGGLSGIVAMSALIASGVVSVGGGPVAGSQNLVVSACQGQGFVAVARPGEHMLVTGKSADGVWLRVYVPGPVGEGWVRATDVNLLAEGPLPAAGCFEVAGVTGTPGPTATATPVPATTSPTGTATATAKPTAKPTAEATTALTAQPTAQPTSTPNVGPVFTMNPPQVSSAGIGTNPLGTGNCGTSGVAAKLTTAATDADGVASIQLWVQKPGTSSYVRLRHDFSLGGAHWYNSIDTAEDNIVDIGTLFYRAVALDTKGAKTTSKSGSLRIFRCDTEAKISGDINLPLSSGKYMLGVCGPLSIPWRYTLSDADRLSGATMTYSISHTGATTLRGTIKLSRLLRSLDWTGSSIAPSSSPPYWGLNTVVWTVTTTDSYGGSTATRTRIATVDYYDTCPPR